MAMAMTVHLSTLLFYDYGYCTLLGSINYALDDEFTVFVFSSFRDFESFECICEFESMSQEWLQID